MIDAVAVDDLLAVFEAAIAGAQTALDAAVATLATSQQALLVLTAQREALITYRGHMDETAEVLQATSASMAAPPADQVVQP